MPIVPTDNAELVRLILTHPQLYPWVSDDGSPPAHAFRPEARADTLWLLARDADGVPVGLFTGRFLNAIAVEVHVAMLPGARGARAVEAARAALAWLKAHTPARKVLGYTPAPYRHAHRFMRAVGFAREGLLTRAFLKHGQRHDLVLYGLSLD